MPLTIYKRGQIYHYRGKVAGRRLRGTTGTSSKDIAEQIANREETKAYQRDLHGPGSVLTFADASVLYRKAGKPTRFLKQVEDYFKDTLVADIKSGTIRQAAMELYPNATNATRNRQAIVPIQAIINYSAESELCAFIKVKRFKTDKKIKPPFTLEWVNAFVAHATPHVGALAMMMFVTGARISEALRLQWDDIDLKARTVTFQKTKISEARQANLPMRLVVMLANLKRVPGRPIFIYRHRNNIIRQWNKAIRLAGIKRMTPHSGRHGFATTALRAGIDPKTGAWLGGWKNIRHFMETYAHAIQDITLNEKILGTPETQLEGEIQERPANKG